jgi:hypothetical protein
VLVLHHHASGFVGGFHVSRFQHEFPEDAVRVFHDVSEFVSLVVFILRRAHYTAYPDFSPDLVLVIRTKLCHTNQRLLVCMRWYLVFKIKVVSP